LPFFFAAPTPFFFAKAPPRGLEVVVVTVDLLEEEAAVDPRVDLVCRLVAMELVFSDMRERNNKKGIVNERGKKSADHRAPANHCLVQVAGGMQKIERGDLA
jgi:hypothetical protein